jgi:hypothetical protein
MRRISFCGVIVAGLVMGFTASTLNAGSPPAGDPINGTLGPQSAPSSSGTVPGGNNYGGPNEPAVLSAVHERGVAGSGLPREKVSVIDPKSLPSTKTDTTFSTSLLSADLKSVKDVKPVTATQKQTKSQTGTDNAMSAAKTSEKSKTQGDRKS